MSAEASEQLHTLLERLLRTTVLDEDGGGGELELSGLTCPQLNHAAAVKDACVQKLLCEAIQVCINAQHQPAPTLGAHHMAVLLTCLEAGHIEAAQLLFLTTITPASHGGGGDHLGGPTLGAPWPPFVYARLAALVAMLPAAQETAATARAQQQRAVVACRILAANAACSAEHAPGGVPVAEPVLRLLRHLATASSTTAAAAGSSSSSSSPSSTPGSSALLKNEAWPRNLGPDGIAALASLAAAASLPDAAAFPRHEAASALLGLWHVLHGSLRHHHAPTPLVSPPLQAAAAAARTSADSHTWWQLQALIETGDGQLGAACCCPGITSTCCAARFVLLRSLAALAVTPPPATTTTTDTALLQRGVLRLVQQLVSESPQVAAPTLDSHGKPAGFKLVPGACMPCTAPPMAQRNHSPTDAAIPLGSRSMPPPRTAAAGCRCCLWLGPPPAASAAWDSWLAAWGLTQPRCLIEASLQLLLVLCATGRRQAAAVLYAADISSCLQQLCGFSAQPVDLTPLLARLFTVLCIDSPPLREEVMMDANLTALAGLIAASGSGGGDDAAPTTSTVPASNSGGWPAVPLRLQAAAMDRLSSTLDTASGADFLAFLGAAGSSTGLAAVLRLLRAHCPPRIPTTTTTTTARQQAATSRVVMGGAAAAVHRQLLACAQATLVAALGRARRMCGMSSPQQLPRVGILAQMPASELRALEAWCLAPAGAAAGSEAPVMPTAAAAAALMTRAPLPADGGNSGGGRLDEGAAGPAQPALARARGEASRSKRSAGAASTGRVQAGCNAATCGDGTPAAATVVHPDGHARGYDEDGLRVCWSSGPSADVCAAREAWKALTLRECLDWTQSSTDVEVTLLLPAGTRKGDVVVSLQADHLTVRLAWRGRVLDGHLKDRVKPSEACWSLGSTGVDLAILLGRRQQRSTLAGTAPSAVSAAPPAPAAHGASSGVQAGNAAPSTTTITAMTELHLILPKEAGGRYWRALFEGGEEKSHMQVLQEAVDNEDDARHAPTPDDLGPEAQLLLEDLRERQAALASGEWSFERHFDDFRLVLGDATM